MKRFLLKVLVLTAGILIISSAGCTEQETANDRQSRLIAVENLKLKKELVQRNEQLVQLEKIHEKYMQEQVNSVLAAMINENAKLRTEIESLKVEIEKLKSQTPRTPSSQAERNER